MNTTIFITFLFLNVIQCLTVHSSNESELLWPQKYHFKGEKLDFHFGIKWTFETWYSKEDNRSRMDVNEGTLRKYYYSDEKRIYTMHPISTENLVSEMKCFWTKTNSTPSTFLPSATGLQYTGNTTNLFDKTVEIWTETRNYRNVSTKEYTLYAYSTKEGYYVPVQYIQKGTNTKVGSLTSHVVINYFDFEDDVTADDLIVPKGDDNNCEFQRKSESQGPKTEFQVLHPNLPGDIDLAFDSYMNHHDKMYYEKELQMRKAIFEANLKMVEKYNSKNLGFKLEVNEFSDQTEEELKYLTGNLNSEDEIEEAEPFPYSEEEIEAYNLPQNFDLRMRAEVTSVKQQGKCSSCWAFAVIGAAEIVIGRSNQGKFVKLSEQSLIDCSWQYNNTGCSGGLSSNALKYISSHGIATEEEYGTYKAINGFCNVLKMNTTYKIKQYGRVKRGNARALKLCTFMGQSCEDPDAPLNHAVLVTGYGVRDGQDYWLVKNSWGEDWGEDGYILMSAKKNNCFVLNKAYYIRV